MKNSDYWKERFAQLEAAQNRKGAEVYAEIEKQYRQAQKEIEAKIDAWYRRFADNNGVSMAEARRMLTARELAELKWDVNDYIKYGRQNAVSQKWMKELENASARFHISRLEALKLQTQQSLEVMFGNQLDGIDAAMKRAFLDSYYHTAYELQKGFGIGWDIAGLDQRQIEKVISKPWAVDGKNFSERIWRNKEKLISEVHNELTQNIMLGQDPQKAIDNIARKMGTSKANAGRLVMTEEAYFSSAAQKDCFNDLGVEQYEIVATLDSYTSEICQSLDGQVFPMKDFEPGVTAPPFHVNCRSTTIPYFEDDFGQPGERAARSEDGKTYYVPADMTYQEWKKSFVEGNKEDLKEVDGKKDYHISNEILGDKIGGMVDQSDKIGIDDYESLQKKILKKYDEITKMRPSATLKTLTSEYKEDINFLIEAAPPKFKNVIQQNQDRIKFAKLNAVGGNHVNKRDGIYINLELDASNPKGKWTSIMHEIGHSIDIQYSRPSQNAVFKKALESDFKVFTEGYAKVYNIGMDEVYETIGELLCNADIEESHIISDLFGGMTGNKCVGKTFHEESYWNKKYSLEHEAFAHFFSASVLCNEKKLDAIKAIFPTAYEEFLKIIGGLS